MADQTPERLKAFRDEAAPKSSSGRGTVLMLVIGIVLGAAGAIASVYVTSNFRGVSSEGRSAERSRELALLYEQKDMPGAAIDAYSDYLDRAQLSDKERAAVTYSIAKLAIGIDDYERALTHLYEGEFLDPESDVRDERSTYIVHCLEQLGRAATLRRELKNRTGSNPGDAPEAGAVVLAEFGGETVTDRDLEQKLEEMPAQLRETYASPEKRIELLKHLVAERLLLDKAYRLKLDENEELQARLTAMRDAFLVQSMIDEEVRRNVTITPEDVERYYKAEQSRFRVPASARAIVANAETEMDAASIVDFNGEPITLREGEPLRGLPDSAAIVDAILATDRESIAGPFEIEGKFYVFKVVSKTPGRVAPFDEVSDRAKRMLHAEKERELAALLIEDTLRARNVKLYPERLHAEPQS